RHGRSSEPSPETDRGTETLGPSWHAREALIWRVILSLVVVVALAVAPDGLVQTRSAAVPIKQASVWVRRAPMLPKSAGDVNASTAAAYLTIRNTGGAADALVGASSDTSDTVELHETYDMSGMVMMRPVASIGVPARGVATLKPGSYHLMLIGLRRELRPGGTVKFELKFQQAGTIAVTARVR